MSTIGSRISTMHLVGGRPCLDLVNTVSWRGDPTRFVDHLTSSEDCLVWCRRAGVVAEEESRDLADLDVRSPLLTLRSALTRHLVDADPPALERLQPYVDNALRHSDLVQHGEHAEWEVTVLTGATPAHRVALDLLDQLTNPPGPLGRCADPACGWAYVDTSRGHRRRWCSSADCGNRERVRRHAARS
jgi:predicted RNA-binding Zn ribbon-like protein